MGVKYFIKNSKKWVISLILFLLLFTILSKYILCSPNCFCTLKSESSDSIFDHEENVDHFLNPNDAARVKLNQTQTTQLPNQIRQTNQSQKKLQATHASQSSQTKQTRQNSQNQQTPKEGTGGEVRSYQIKLRSGWEKPPMYIIEPEPEKNIRIEPGKLNQVIFNFTLYNEGDNASISYKVQVPKNWSAEDIPNNFYENYTNSTDDNLQVIVYPSTDREDITSGYSFPVKLTAFVTDAPQINDSIFFYVKIEFWPYAVLFAPENEYVKPTTDIINCTLVNDGNSYDSFEISVRLGETVNDESALRSIGWTANIYSEKITRIMARGQSETIQIKLTVPIIEPALKTVKITLSAISTINPEHFDAEQVLVFNVTVDIYKSLMISRLDLENNIIEYNETPKLVELKVTNTGNYQNDDFNITVKDQPENWSLILDLSSVPAEGLSIHESSIILLKIIIPEDTFEGLYLINLSATSYDKEGQTIETENDLMLSIYVPKTSNITLHLLEQIKSSLPGKVIIYDVRVMNLGNSYERVKLWFNRDVGETEFFNITISKKEFEIAPFKYEDVQLSISISTDTPADPVPITEKKENYSIILKCESLDMFYIQIQTIIEFEILPIYDFSININDDSINIIRHPDINSTPDNITIELINLGNYHDLILFSITGPSWLKIEDNNSLNLSYKQTRKLTIILDYKFIPENGEYEIKITGISSFNNSIKKELELSVTVADFDIYIPILKINDKQLTKTELKINEPIRVEFMVKKNQSENYFSERSWSIRITIYLINSNGTFNIIDIFEISENQVNLQFEYAFDLVLNETGFFILLVRADLINGTRKDEGNLENNKNFIEIKITRPSEQKNDQIMITLELFIVFMAILILMIIFSLLVLIEIFRYSLLKSILRAEKPRSKTSKLQQGSKMYKDSRNRIFTYIRLNPGVRYTELKLQLGLSSLETIHHLENLKNEKFILFKRKGSHIYFFPSFSELKKKKI